MIGLDENQTMALNTKFPGFDKMEMLMVKVKYFSLLGSLIDSWDPWHQLCPWKKWRNWTQTAAMSPPSWLQGILSPGETTVWILSDYKSDVYCFRLVSAFRDKIERCHDFKPNTTICDKTKDWYFKKYGQEMINRYRTKYKQKFGEDSLLAK